MDTAVGHPDGETQTTLVHDVVDWGRHRFCICVIHLPRDLRSFDAATEVFEALGTLYGWVIFTNLGIILFKDTTHDRFSHGNNNILPQSLSPSSSLLVPFCFLANRQGSTFRHLWRYRQSICNPSHPLAAGGAARSSSLQTKRGLR